MKTMGIEHQWQGWHLVQCHRGISLSVCVCVMRLPRYCVEIFSNQSGQGHNENGLEA